MTKTIDLVLKCPMLLTRLVPSHRLFVLIGVVAVHASITNAQSQFDLDKQVSGDIRITSPSALPPCDAGAAVIQLSIRLNVLVGLESTPDCWLPPTIRPVTADAETLTGVTARMAFDHVIAQMPQYSWREMNGVIVVRPKEAWKMPLNVLNRPSGGFEANGERLDDVFRSVVQVPRSRDVENPTRDIDRPVTVKFAGGTMLEALNALLRSRQDGQWQVGYARADKPTIVIRSSNPTGGFISAPIDGDTTRR